jgi:hypothetical protein
VIQEILALQVFLEPQEQLAILERREQLVIQAPKATPATPAFQAILVIQVIQAILA